MNEERIWAPWRLGYIAGDQPAPPPPTPVRWQDGADQECFLCRAAAEYDDPDASRRLLLAAKNDASLVVLNRFPYTNGHLLISPLRHVADLSDLTAEEGQQVFAELTRWTKQLGNLIRAEGFNIGLNLGSVAGAGVPGHLHWHLVPRWPGDANFMPVTAGARVIPQSLEALWDAITNQAKSDSLSNVPPPTSSP